MRDAIIVLLLYRQKQVVSHKLTSMLCVGGVASTVNVAYCTHTRSTVTYRSSIDRENIMFTLYDTKENKMTRDFSLYEFAHRRRGFSLAHRDLVLIKLNWSAHATERQGSFVFESFDANDRRRAYSTLDR